MKKSEAALENLMLSRSSIRNYYIELTYPKLSSYDYRYVEGLASHTRIIFHPKMLQRWKSQCLGYIVGWSYGRKSSTHFQVSDLIEDSPADKAEMINDVFVSVDDNLAKDYDDVTALAKDIRGEEGTTVTIVIFRPSENKEYTFDIERQQITNSNIHSRMIDDEIGYIRIVTFNDSVSDNFIDAMEKLQEKGAKNIILTCETIVVDMLMKY